MNGITYFRLNSPYPGDITKNCALDPYEVDRNFFVLEGRDIKSVSVSDDDLVISLLNGETINAKNAFQNFTKDISFDFDPTKGILYIKRNGITQEITGFASSYNIGEAISVDHTMQGSGEPCNPIGISKMYQTGLFTPVKKLVDTCNCEQLPPCEKCMVGDRYITIEHISDYGLLYNFEGLKKIACDLKAANSPWRVPTKEDWDDMLNAIEPCDSDKDHSSATSNKYLGRYAGKFLKSCDLWKLECEHDHCHHDHCHHDHHHHGHCCSTDFNKCEIPYCGEVGHNHCMPYPYPNKGVNKFGFNINPTGYADDGANFGYFMERACFWSSTNAHYTNAYVKRFEYNKSSVYQDVVSGDFYLSLRLVKDYDGSNYNERENILDGVYSTVLMPSQKKGHAIWTSSNIDLSNRCYNPLLPNNGMGLSTTKRYFINEWDGNKWLRNELKEGYGVVIMDAPNGNKNIEYRVVNGLLSDVSLSVYEDVMTGVTPKLEHLKNMIRQETERAVSRENQIHSELKEEIQRSTEYDIKLQNELDSLKQFNSDEHERIIQIITNEVNERIKGDEQLWTAVNNAISEYQTYNQQLWTALNSEIENRQNTDNELWSAINSFKEDYNGATQHLWEAINNAISEYQETDRQLWEALNKEKEERENVNNQLWEAVNEEINKRTQTDTEIWTAIEEGIAKQAETNQKLWEAINKALDVDKEDDKALWDAINNAISDYQASDRQIWEALNNAISEYQETDRQLWEALNNAISEYQETDRQLWEAINNIKEEINDIKDKIEENFNHLKSELERIEAKLDAEIERSIKEDEYIKGRLISKEGHEFNCKKGYLKLMTDKQENIITIELDSNYGTF